MTCEVAILNKSAVVVAADSAVTTGQDKVHRSANKIFALCNEVPIGIMIYDYAEYASIPWETIVKLFRAERSRKFLTVQECFGEFKLFLSDKRFIDDKSIINSFVFFVGDFIEKTIKDKLKDVPRRMLSATIKELIEQETADAFSKKIEHHSYAVALHFMYYNFARIHKTLRVTPAMAARLTDRLWDVADIVDLLDAAEEAPKRPATYRKRAA